MTSRASVADKLTVARAFTLAIAIFTTSPAPVLAAIHLRVECSTRSDAAIISGQGWQPLPAFSISER
jgi:hypothetical protein